MQATVEKIPHRKERRFGARRAFSVAVAVVAALAVWSLVGPRHSRPGVAGYCATVRAGFTTALNTETRLGPPDSRYRHTIDGQPTLFLTYGTTTLAYRWTGELDSSTYVTGC